MSQAAESVNKMETTGCTLLAPQQQHELDSAVSTRKVHRHSDSQSLKSGRGDAGGVDGVGG